MRVREFCNSRNLQDKVEEMRIKHDSVEEEFLYYYAASNYIRTNFFISYPGLQDRITRNELFAKEHGYIRSYHGAIRHTPLLMWCTDPYKIDNRNGKPQVRPDEDYKEMAGLINITANTSIQNDEVSDMSMAITRWIDNDEYFDKAPIYGMVHDSSDFYIKREGLEETIKQVQEVFELSDDEWQDGIKLSIEGAVVDYNKPGHYYKHGETVIA